MGRIILPPEVSEQTRIAEDTLKYWRYTGTGPPWFKLGGRVVYDSDEVDAWIEQQRATTGTAQ
jgi:predicted DNA-binding transcriptional regulator AlpA